MTMTTAHLTETALTLAAARERFDRAFNDYYESLEVLPDERFYELAAKFITLLTERLNRERTVKRTCGEFFRLPSFWRGCLAGTCGGGTDPGYTTEDAMRFVKTVEARKAVLYRPLFDVIEGRGSDGYGDLLDGLAIVLPEGLYDAVLDGKFAKMKFFKDEFDESVDPALRYFIWNGENYFGMRLRDEARNRALNEAVINAEFEPDGENPLAVQKREEELLARIRHLESVLMLAVMDSLGRGVDGLNPDDPRRDAMESAHGIVRDAIENG